MDSIIQWLKDHFWHIESLVANAALLWCFLKRRPKSRKPKTAPTANVLNMTAVVLAIVTCFFIIVVVMFTRPPAEPQRLAHDDLSTEFKLKYQGLEIAMNANRKTSYFIETPYYKIAPAPNEQMVNGKNGKYFYVDLNSAQRKTIRFAPGEYTLNKQDNLLFQNALQKFQFDVMEWAQEGDAEIYIRGQADSQSDATFKNAFQEQTCLGTEHFSDISYHPAISAKTSWYALDRTKKKLAFGFGMTLIEPLQGLLEQLGVPRIYRNADLPELRARYLQCQYRQMFPNTSISILEGRVNPAIGPEFREATLLLYIPEKSIQQVGQR